MLRSLIADKVYFTHKAPDKLYQQEVKQVLLQGTGFVTAQIINYSFI